MAGDWVSRSLGDLYDFRSGLSKPGSEFGSGYPFLTFKDVFYNFFVPDVLGDLVESTEEDQRACDIRRGDVFLTRTSETMDELGMSCVALKDFPHATFNGFTKRLRPKSDDEVIPEFAGYLFRSPGFRRDVTAMSTLSTRASLNNEMLCRLQVRLPSVETQRAIGGILKALDDKIALNRHTNRALENMARANFKAWFIDFEPVKAKADGALSFPGMPQDVFDRLPREIGETEAGQLPQGWNYEPIGEVVDVVGGGTPSTTNPDFWDGGDNAFCTPKDMSRLTSPVLLDTERYITQAGVDKISSGQLPIGTVLLSSRAPIGYLALAATPVSVNQGIIAMLTGDIPNTYVLLWTEANMDIIKSRAGGSTFAEISKRNFRPIPALRPDDATLQAFGAATSPLFDLITANERESQVLVRLRDTLLPKLMSGEIGLTEDGEVQHGG